MRIRLWTWSGHDFGSREGDELWTHDGRHVGHFYGTEVYGQTAITSARCSTTTT